MKLQLAKIIPLPADRTRCAGEQTRWPSGMYMRNTRRRPFNTRLWVSRQLLPRRTASFCITGTILKALREVWWKRGEASTLRPQRPRNCRRSRKDGSGRLVMGRAQPTGYLEGSLHQPWNPRSAMRATTLQYCARSESSTLVTGAEFTPDGWSATSSRRRRSPLRRVRSPGEEGV
jgi:hypothetical protein